jgi:hypothetical protein
MYQRMGICSGPNEGKVIDPASRELVSDPGTPVQYTYSGRFNSGPLYGDLLNTTFFFERKSGDSYIRGTGYDGYTLGLEAEGILRRHKLQFTFLLSTQYHGQAFALQDTDLLEKLGREYNRKNHEWQENSYTKPFWALRHDWRLSERIKWTSHLFYTLGKGADQTCANDFFDTKTGEVGFQDVSKGKDAYSFGMHALYLYRSFGMLSTDFVPGDNSIMFKGIPSGHLNPEGLNFFADLHSHSYQTRARREHRQIGMISYMTNDIGEKLHTVYGLDMRHWRGNRNSEVHLLRMSNLDDPYYSLWAPYPDPNFISEVQSIYDYDTDVLNGSLFGRINWKAAHDIIVQAGLQLYYTRAEVIENPIRQIDFGSLQYFPGAVRTTADIYDYDRKFGLTNDYLRQYTYVTPWIGTSYRLNDRIDLFSRLANAKKEPAILDWYDFSDGPLLQKDVYPDEPLAVNLVPESVTNAEIGCTWRLDQLSVRAGYYRSWYYDKIERVVDFSGRQKTLNAGEALYQGIETDVRWQWNRLSLQLAAALSRNRWQKMNVAEIFGSNASDVVGKVVPFAPERMLSASVFYGFEVNPLNRFSLGVRFQYWDDYYATYTNDYIHVTENIIDGLHYIERETREAKLPFFLDLSASLNYALTTRFVEFNFRIDAHNILNRSDNYLRAQYTIDYTRNDFYQGRYHWYVLQAPLFNLFLTMEVRLRENT